MQTFLFIGLGGFFGANARYFVSVVLGNLVGKSFPWSTFFVNVTGSALLAWFLAWSSGRLTITPQARLFIATGFFGAYTTFSTFANESVTLGQAGDWPSALGNIVANNIAAIIGVLLGLALASRF